MIHVGTTQVTKIEVGSHENPTIHIGTFKTFPTGEVTTAVSNPTVIYSSGNMINAGGTNYAYIQATLTTYVDNVAQSSSTVKLTATTESAASIWTISDNNIYAADRGTITGNSRTATVKGTYGSYTSPNLTVTQAANTSTEVNGAITRLDLDGTDDNPYVITCEIQQEGSTMQSIGVGIDGYRIRKYSSGAETKVPISNYTYTWDPSGAYAWIGVEMSGNIPVEITASTNDSTTVETRSATITFYDPASNYQVSASREIIQQSKYLWDIDFPSTRTIQKNDTSFSLTFTVKKMQQPFTAVTVNSFGIEPNNSNIAVQTVTHNGNGSYTATFSCLPNASEEEKYSRIILIPGPNQKSCYITHEGTTAFEGIDIKARSSNKEWALGVLTSSTGAAQGQSFNINGIILACKHPITSETTINVYQLTWGYYGSDPQTDSTRSKTISTGATVTIGTKVYYGAWLETPRRDLYISSVSQIIVS